MLHESTDAAFKLESIGFLIAFVRQGDTDTRVEEGQFAQTFREYLVVKLDISEGFRTGLEVDNGTRSARVAYWRKRRLWHAVNVELLVFLAITMNLKG